MILEFVIDKQERGYYNSSRLNSLILKNRRTDMLNASYVSAFSRKARAAYESILRPLCEEYSLNQNELDILLFLANNPDNTSAGDICELRGLKPGIVSLYVDKLATAGYISRAAKPDDRRKIILTLTDKAQPIIEQGQLLQHDFAARLSSGLTATEIQIIKDAFKTVSENIDKMQKGE